MIKLKPYSSTILAVGGLLLMGMGIYFVWLRPALLSEDVQYMKTSVLVMNEVVPGLSHWLQKVFWVMGAYIFTTGLLTVFISYTSFRTRTRGVCSVVALTGMSSIGSMTVVNFMIDSDFKWLLLIFIIPWAIALILYKFNK